MKSDAAKRRKLEQQRFIHQLSALQQRFPPGAQFNLFANLGYTNHLIVKKRDAKRCASRWACPPDQFREHLQKLLDAQFLYFQMMQDDRHLRALISKAIIAYVKQELGTDLHHKFQEPTDRELTSQISDYFRWLPKDQQAVIVSIK